jgi:hypothetical protein
MKVESWWRLSVIPLTMKSYASIGKCRSHVFEGAYICKGSRRFSSDCGKPTQDGKKYQNLMIVNLKNVQLVVAQASGLYH